jgi:uncharacterized protein (DUF1330 family)
MNAYAIAQVMSVDFGPDIVEYLRRIDGTLDTFGGRFRFHGGAKEQIEGEWQGDLIIIEFPDYAAARAWYESPEYQEILPLRTDHMVANTILIEGVPDGYRGESSLKYLLPEGA